MKNYKYDNCSYFSEEKTKVSSLYNIVKGFNGFSTMLQQLYKQNDRKETIEFCKLK